MLKKSALENLIAFDKKIKQLDEIEALLGWDREVNMPEKGSEQRAEQSALVASYHHSLLISDTMKKLLDAVSDENLSDIEKGYVAFIQKKYDTAVCLSGEWVEEESKVLSMAQDVWVEAKKKNDFKLFQPWLEKIVKLQQERGEFLASCVPNAKNVYDVLLDQYEPSVSSELLSTLFSEVEPALGKIVQIRKEKQSQQPAWVTDLYPIEGQRTFAGHLLKYMSFDTLSGRLDETMHPFTTTLGGQDVRITTHYYENLLQSSIFSIIHEAGHGLYEQNIDPWIRLTSAGSGISMGIHESQSRMWENIFGRGKSFWTYLFPLLKQEFPSQLGCVNLDSWVDSINYITPSLIRTEADEVTYSLHIMLRFKIEQALITNQISVSQVPEMWNSLMKEMLGIVPSTDSEGCLQDVHWAAGLFGYFPSYALGNFYGAQFVSAMKKDGININSCLENAELNPIHSWLKKNIWQYGSTMLPADLLLKATGNTLSSKPFINYLEEKYCK